MNYNLILVRFGELTIKGRNRRRFESLMFTNIKQALASFSKLEFERSYGRLFIHLNGENFDAVSERLSEIFGLSSFSPVVRAENKVEAIQDAALQVMRGLERTPKTFKVTVRRTWKDFPHDSQQMNHLVGAYVLRNTPDLKVDVRNPEIELKVDIQAEATFVYCRVIPGAGGFPIGMNGKAMLLLSGGIDSPVAGWMAMRKGLEIEAVHFHSYPFTSEQATEKVVSLTQRLAHYGGRLKLHLVPFTEIQTMLAQKGRENLIITLMRRSMLRIAEKLAERSGALALVTGDSLGQVASQTLGSMNVIGRTVSLPLLRPLVMMDKLDIIRQAEKIGTYETSILPYEDCCTLFVPKSPATNPNLHVVERIEAGMKAELERLIEEAVAGTETVLIDSRGRVPAARKAEAAGTADEDRWF
ncbi:MAG: tRNA 4-thiouridine(8) synthase ThiI [Cohnella sp.]|uniref:tRNA uracil 4-sulfurtransferase ThiI n=1 Tax=Cohnella sp. TaxID=1883426 RepID=UPI000E39F300|nr:tRNA uracil 4-sulfurtransferase ThiI [Cohnella sp.]REK66998.1 MAG: tRNA 4-thiouridine(8) synthase ThiI [Cohnella sp.]